jgi:hypothetical protein
LLLRKSTQGHGSGGKKKNAPASHHAHGIFLTW